MTRRTGKTLNSVAKRNRKAKLHHLQSGKCFWCDGGMAEQDATMDELLPRSRGGTQRWDNIVLACQPCNFGRGNSMPPRWAVEKVKLREAIREALEGV